MIQNKFLFCSQVIIDACKIMSWDYSLLSITNKYKRCMIHLLEVREACRSTRRCAVGGAKSSTISGFVPKALEMKSILLVELICSTKPGRIFPPSIMMAPWVVQLQCNTERQTSWDHTHLQREEGRSDPRVDSCTALISNHRSSAPRAT